MSSWLESKGYELGAAVAPQTLYELGRDWYATRLDVDWQPATAAQAQELFTRHGLVGQFWSLTR